MSNDQSRPSYGKKAKAEEQKLARSASRLAAVQALYQMEMTGVGWHEVRAEFENHRIGAEIEGEQYRDADIPHFRAVLEGVVTRQREIDQATDAALVAKWPLGKVDPTLRALFRCGVFELLAMPKIPARVAITEYVDVAKAFFPDGKESKFANAVLDHVAHEMRAEEMSARKT